MDAKREFVRLASTEGVNVRELCRRFHVSPTTGYALLARAEGCDGEEWLQQRSRRPLSSPTRTDSEMEKRVLELRDETHWGARKIAHVLRKRGYDNAPPRSTVHSILRRHGRIDVERSEQTKQWHRFEHPEPNDLWQMDFKGWFPTGATACHALTVLDDHSRFSVALRACANETTDTVQRELENAFDRYGLPWRMTMDNGAPWGYDGSDRLTRLTVWLIRIGVRVSHSRPYHPQTQGKDERFHQTLDYELLRYVSYRDIAEAQQGFDRWRDRYNFERPHESLDLATPAERYRPSARSMPTALPSIEYDPTDVVCRVDPWGRIRFRQRKIPTAKGCAGLPVAVRCTTTEDVFDVFFCHQKIASFDLRDHE
jgi:transposase InsO family protein